MNLSKEQVGRAFEEFSRRDFLKSSPFFFAAFLLLISGAISGCSAEDETPVELQSLRWKNALENLTANSLNYEVENFNNYPDGRPRYRKLTFNNIDPPAGLGGPNRLLEVFAPAEDEDPTHYKERQMVVEFLREKVKKIIIIQENVAAENEPENWVSLKIPGSRMHIATTEGLAKDAPNQFNKEQIIQAAAAIKDYLGADSTQDPEQLARTVAMSKILEIAVDPKITKEQAQEVIRRYLIDRLAFFPEDKLPNSRQEWDQWTEITRGIFKDIPESIKMKDLIEVVRAIQSPFSDDVYEHLNGRDYTDEEIMDAVMNNAGIGALDCIIVPKETNVEKAKQIEEQSQALVEKFKEVPKKPRVFKVLMDDGTNRIAVIHDMQNNDLHNQLVHDERINVDNIINDINAKNSLNLTLQAVNEAAQIELGGQTLKERVEILLGKQGKILTMEEFPTEAIGTFLVPNKFFGTINGERLSRLACGIKCQAFMHAPQSGENLASIDSKEAVILFGEALRDELGPVKFIDQSPEPPLKMDNWITDVTSLAEETRAKGITEIYPEGWMSSIELLARILRGSSDNAFMDYPLLAPDNRYLRDLLADAKIKDLLDERGKNPNAGINMACFLDEIILQKITLTDFKLDKAGVEKTLDWLGIDKSGWWQNFLDFAKKYTEHGVNEDRNKTENLVANNEVVKMAKGDFFPIVGVIEIDGKKWMILKEITDNSLPELKKDSQLIAIPFEEALKKVLILDPDNNLIEFAKKVKDWVLVPAFLIGLIVAPEAVGAVAGTVLVASGKLVQQQLLKILSTIGSKAANFFI